MEIIFSDSKNGERTCSIDGKFLHSKYNPSNEAEKFVENISNDFNALAIIIIEGGLSYSVPFLRKKFPDAKICTIRADESFKDYDSNWDYVFYPDDDFENLKNDLFNVLGEEILCSALALDWPAARNIFPEKSEKIWKCIKDSILYSRDILGTRAYFSKRWIKNSILFARNIQRTAIPDNTDLPIVIAASGTSLKTSLPFLKEYRKRFILIALSSAFVTLKKHSIEPDMVMSSDGGYWAKKHLIAPGLDSSNILYALEIESAVPKEVFENNEIIPLVYEDSTGKEFLDSINCPYLYTKRNGTISGTALEFALNYTSSKVFFCGLDQESSSGFQHTQPNNLEKISELSDFRLRTKETRLTFSQFSSEGSLSIYRNWFSVNSSRFKERVFRLSDHHHFKNSLGEIKDVCWDFFDRLTKSCKSEGVKKIALNSSLKEDKIRKELILEKLKEYSEKEEFTREIFPMKNLLFRREIDSKIKAELKQKIKDKTNTFIQEMEKLL